MKKAYKFRIYPTSKQEIKLIKTLDTCRNLYNNSLEERIKAHELQQMSIPKIIKDNKPNEAIRLINLRKKNNYYEQQKGLVELKEKYPEYREVYSQVLQDILKRLDKSFDNFFRRVKNKENPGFPRFKSKNRFDSFTYSQKGFELKDDDLNLSKIGSIRIFQHREIEGIIKTCTIKRDIDQWYCTIVTEINEQITQVPIINKVGVDVGLKTFLTLSNGEQIESPKYLLESERRLTKEQRRLSRKKFRKIEVTDKKTNKLKKIKVPTKNRVKQRIKVAKAHRKIRNQRKDFNHKTSRKLVNNYDMIVFEGLNIQNMMMNSHSIRNRNISDVAWYRLQTFTSYKAEWAGKKVIFVNPKNTSQICSNCGNLEYLTLHDRIFSCSKCGSIKDRDLNAAINILNRGIKNVPTDCGEFTPMEKQKLINEVGSSLL